MATDLDAGSPSSRVLVLLEELRSEYERERAVFRERPWMRMSENVETAAVPAQRPQRSEPLDRLSGPGVSDGTLSMNPFRSCDSSEALGAKFTHKPTNAAGMGYVLRHVWQEAPPHVDWDNDLEAVLFQGCGVSSTVRGGNGKASIIYAKQQAFDVANTFKHSLTCTASCGVLSPNSTGRLSWDAFGCFLIGYDVLSIPMLAFEMPPNTFSIMMEWFTLLFWTADLLMSFHVGYFEKGILVTDRKKIVRHYLLTWFVIDCIVVVPDWFMTLASHAFADSADVSGLGRLLRAARAVRVLRLLRLFKLQRILSQIQEMIESEYAFTLVGLIKLLLCILLLNHVIACIWYLIGNKTMEAGTRNWLEKTGTNHTSVAYSYTTSLHWSLTQFTPASMDVSATNVYERTFSILVLLFAIVAFSSIIASITGSMTSMNNAKGEEMKQFWLLRRYLRQRNVNKDLTGRIFKYLEYRVLNQNRSVQVAKCTLIKMLSEPLRDELASAINSPILVRHEFFRVLSKRLPFVLHQLCNSALKVVLFASGDDVFTHGTVAKAVYFTKSGSLVYTRPRFHTSEDILEQDEIWISEPALWTVWRHLGSLIATSPSELLQVESKEFSNIISLHPQPWYFAKSYAAEYVQLLNTMGMTEISDVLHIEDEEFYERAVAAGTRSSTDSVIRNTLFVPNIGDSIGDSADLNSFNPRSREAIDGEERGKESPEREARQPEGQGQRPQQQEQPSPERESAPMEDETSFAL